MMTFDAIGTALLKAHGYEVLECACGTGLLTGVIAHKRRSRLSPV
jgi:ubiquinone/menaquinone biosynthesis C-methylase UbiE